MIHYILRLVYDGYFRRCCHRSHRLRLRCYRGYWYDGYCAHHNDICYEGSCT